MDILKSKNFSEAGKCLGYNYYNGNVKKQVIKYFNNEGLNCYDVFEKNKKNEEKHCLFCGKLLEGKVRKNRKFCNSSCSAKYNNSKRKLSEETKAKISETLNKRYLENKKLNVENRVCQICGKVFKPHILKNGKVSKAKVCSEKCRHELKSQKSKEIVNKLIKEGKHQGWKSRNITSYPEKFWINVLCNNNINFIREDFTNKKYFLDFLIEKNDKKIDLEIDGKQHQYVDRKQNDIKRDLFLKNKGYIVYRIPWNEINTSKGKMMMHNKINDFINFYQQL